MAGAECDIGDCTDPPTIHVVVVDRDDPSNRLAWEVCTWHVLKAFWA